MPPPFPPIDDPKASTAVGDDLVRHFALRTSGRIAEARLGALARAGYQEAIETFPPDEGLSFDCFAWVRIHAKLFEVANPVEAASPELTLAREAAYDILVLDEGEEGDEPAGDPVERLERFCTSVATAMLMGWVTYLKRHKVEPGGG